VSVLRYFCIIGPGSENSLAELLWLLDECCLDDQFNIQLKQFDNCVDGVSRFLLNVGIFNKYSV
jgi:hypothetical protein